MKDREKHIKELEKTADFLLENIENAMIDLEGEPLSVKYDHGGGQSGRKENPAFTAFEKMVKSYQSVINQLDSMTDNIDKKSEYKNKLQIVGNSKWKRA